MNLALVQFGVAITMALLTSWAALVIVTALALPQQAQRARNLLDSKPKKCFLTGIGMAILVFIALTLVGNPQGPIKLTGFVLALLCGGILIMGGAGIASLLGTRIGEMSGARTSFGMLVRGSLVHSFAMLFPLLGWFLMLPLSILFALGSGVLAVLPQKHTYSSPVVPPLSHDATGVA